MFLANFAHYVYPSTFVLFADAAYGWKEKQAGYVLAVVGVLSVIVNVMVVGRMVKALGERRAMMLGLTCGTAGFVVYGLAGSGWLFLLGLPISALWAVAAPATMALVTQQVPADVQGRIQGSLSSLVSLAGIFAPALFAGAFGFFIGRARRCACPASRSCSRPCCSGSPRWWRGATPTPRTCARRRRRSPDPGHWHRACRRAMLVPTSAGACHATPASRDLLPGPGVLRQRRVPRQRRTGEARPALPRPTSVPGRAPAPWCDPKGSTTIGDKKPPPVDSPCVEGRLSRLLSRS